MLNRLAQALNVDVADLLESGDHPTCDACAPPRDSVHATSQLERTCQCRHTSGGSPGAPSDFPLGQALKPLANALNVTVEAVESAIAITRENARQTD